MAQVEIIRILDSPGRAPAGMAWDGQYLWLNDYESGMLYQLNQETGKEARSLLCAGIISGLTYDGHSLWQTRLDENWIQRLNPTKLDIDETVNIDGYGRLSDLTWDGQHLWVISQSEGRLLAVNPENAQVVSTFQVPAATTAVAYKNGGLWISYAHQMEYHPDTDSFEWIGEERHFYLAQINPINEMGMTRYALDFIPMGIEWVGQRLWVAHPATATLHEGQLT